MKEKWDMFKSEMSKEYQVIQQIAGHLNNMKNDISMSSSGGVS